MTTLEKHIIYAIENKYGFPYLDYSREEQTWTSEFFLFDIKTGVMFVSDEVKEFLYKKYGKGYIEKVLTTVVSTWFLKSYKLPVKEVH